MARQNLPGRAHRQHVFAVPLLEHRREFGRPEQRILSLQRHQLRHQRLGSPIRTVLRLPRQLLQAGRAKPLISIQPLIGARPCHTVNLRRHGHAHPVIDIPHQGSLRAHRAPPRHPPYLQDAILLESLVSPVNVLDVPGQYPPRKKTRGEGLSIGKMLWLRLRRAVLSLARRRPIDAFGRGGLARDLRLQRLGGIAPRRRLDGLAVLANARRAVGPELLHVGVVDDVEKRCRTDAHLHERAEGEVDQVDHGVGLVDNVRGFHKLIDLLAHPRHARVAARRRKERGTLFYGMAKRAVELRDLIECIVETHRRRIIVPCTKSPHTSSSFRSRCSRKSSGRSSSTFSWCCCCASSESASWRSSTRSTWSCCCRCRTRCRTRSSETTTRSPAG